MALHFLNDADIAVLRELIEERKNRRINTPSRPHTDRSWTENEDHQAPEVYIIETVGVDALDAPGTGTEQSIGEGDLPAEGTGTVFKIVDGALQYAGFSKQINNLSTQRVPGGWNLIIRDKFGSWIVLPGLERNWYVREGFLLTSLAAPTNGANPTFAGVRPFSGLGTSWAMQEANGEPVTEYVYNRDETLSLEAGTYIIYAPTEDGEYRILWASCNRTIGTGSLL